jgi:anti-sigma factor RsiW
MSDCRSIEALVTPYVDGELPEGERRHLDAHLAACPPCYSRVAAERAVREALSAHRRELASKAAPPALRAACTRLCSRQSAVDSRQSIGALGTQAPGTHALGTHALSTQHPTPNTGSLWQARLVPFALAASLVIIVGGAFVYQMTEMSETVLAAELTADHLKCLAMNAVLGTHQTPSAVEAAMLGGFGWKMTLPDNPAQVGLELVGARPCMYGEGTIAHLMYKHNGTLVSVFMLPKSSRAERLVGVLGHEAKIWCAGSRTFVLIAREPRHEVEQLARFVQSSLH